MLRKTGIRLSENSMRNNKLEHAAVPWGSSMPLDWSIVPKSGFRFSAENDAETKS